MPKSKLESVWTLTKKKLPTKRRQVVLVIKSPNKKGHYLELGFLSHVYTVIKQHLFTLSDGGTVDGKDVVAWTEVPKTFKGKKLF